MKFGQLIEYNKRYILLEKTSKEWGREISPRPLLFLKKRYIKVKASGL